jgi:hypothetical protein
MLWDVAFHQLLQSRRWNRTLSIEDLPEILKRHLAPCRVKGSTAWMDTRPMRVTIHQHCPRTHTSLGKQTPACASLSVLLSHFICMLLRLVNLKEPLSKVAWLSGSWVNAVSLKVTFRMLSGLAPNRRQILHWNASTGQNIPSKKSNSRRKMFNLVDTCLYFSYIQLKEIWILCYSIILALCITLVGWDSSRVLEDRFFFTQLTVRYVWLARFFIIVVLRAQNINILLSNFAKTFTTLQTSLVLYPLLQVFKTFDYHFRLSSYKVII